MGERAKNREAVERTAARVVEHSRQQGRYMTADAARDLVVKGARESDTKRERGEFKKRGGK